MRQSWLAISGRGTLRDDHRTQATLHHRRVGESLTAPARPEPGRHSADHSPSLPIERQPPPEYSSVADRLLLPEATARDDGRPSAVFLLAIGEGRPAAKEVPNSLKNAALTAPTRIRCRPATALSSAVRKCTAVGSSMAGLTYSHTTNLASDARETTRSLNTRMSLSDQGAARARAGRHRRARRSRPTHPCSRSAPRGQTATLTAFV